MLLAVYTSVDSADTARALARALVECGLAACAQVSTIESCYRWKGSVETAHEWRILFKTTDDRYGAVEAAIRALHPYELPDIHAVAFEHAFAPYAAWIEEGSHG